MRNRLDQQLEKLNLELIEMGALCEKAILQAVNALMKNDSEAAKRVVPLDSEIDQKERDIEALCLKMLLQQQPVAKDLRQISSALKMITDMERIGDQAADIAEITSYIQVNIEKDIVTIKDMAMATIKMVTESIDAYVKKDMALANAVIEYDDVVDAYFDEVKRKLIAMICEDSQNGEYVIDLLMIAKYFERIGDHATNIAEWVEFSIVGEHQEKM